MGWCHVAFVTVNGGYGTLPVLCMSYKEQLAMQTCLLFLPRSLSLNISGFILQQYIRKTKIFKYWLVIQVQRGGILISPIDDYMVQLIPIFTERLWGLQGPASKAAFFPCLGWKARNNRYTHLWVGWCTILAYDDIISTLFDNKCHMSNYHNV